MEDKKLNALSDEALDAVTGGKGKVYCQKNEETGMFDVIDEMTGRCICSFNTLEDAEKFIELGASRLGTSRIVKLARAQEQ